MTLKQRAGAVALCTALLCVFVSTCAAVATVQSEPKLEDFADEIHPYAFAHKLSLPQYQRHHNAYSGVDAFESFLELPEQLEVRPLIKGSPEAESLVAVELASTATATEKSQENEQFIGGALKAIGGAIKNVLGIGGKKGDPNDPASEDEMPLKGNAGAFINDPRRHGTFPGNDNYRRAVYGLRRRRMPYTTSRTFGSLNPYRRPNDFHKNSMDYLFPRDRFYLATHPGMTDFGKEGPSGVFPYGDYSSFTPSHSLIPGRWDYRLRGRAMLGDIGGTVNLPFQPLIPPQGSNAFYNPIPSSPQTVVIVGGGGPGPWGGYGGPGGFGGPGGPGFGGPGGPGSKWNGQKFAAKGGKPGADGPKGGAPGDAKGGAPPAQEAPPAGAPPQQAAAPPAAGAAPADAAAAGAAPAAPPAGAFF